MFTGLTNWENFKGSSVSQCPVFKTKAMTLTFWYIVYMNVSEGWSNSLWKCIQRCPISINLVERMRSTERGESSLPLKEGIFAEQPQLHTCAVSPWFPAQSKQRASSPLPCSGAHPGLTACLSKESSLATQGWSRKRVCHQREGQGHCCKNGGFPMGHLVTVQVPCRKGDGKKWCHL